METQEALNKLIQLLIYRAHRWRIKTLEERNKVREAVSKEILTSELGKARQVGHWPKTCKVED
jgi:hypothetical protein